MGSMNSVAEAKTEEDPSTNQGDVEEESPRTLIEDQRDVEESKTIPEDQKDGEESKTLSEDQVDVKESKTLIEDQGDEEESKTLDEDLDETEEESGECPLCQFIKVGECKEAFTELENCCDEAKKNNEDHVSKCKEARLIFKTCMYDNPVYYEPLLAGEARAMAKMLSELLNAEKEAIMAGEPAVIARAFSGLQEENAEPILPAEAAAIGKAFRELEAGKKKEKEAEGSKGNESDHQNQN
ncbi:unnamed protein product [Arabidopsis thaliana]|uniref:GCK domain-containing protein n=1 Tax=Arabidopsis thaliana TaxID=3702 RepID=A0A654GCG8_ARATH|nr:unnamed protein product [Arabidopsis thaliana]